MVNGFFLFCYLLDRVMMNLPPIFHVWCVLQGGVLVAVVRNCNAPLLIRTITEQLAHEHKVLDGQAERIEVRTVCL